MELYKNESVKVTYVEDSQKPYILWNDLKDNYKGFTQNVRGLKKAVEFFTNTKEVLTMGKVTDLLDEFKLKPHTYCGMD